VFTISDLQREQQRVFATNPGLRSVKTPHSMDEVLANVDEVCDRQLLVVEIGSQLLRVFIGGRQDRQYKVSTSLRGAGCRNGTGCTPLGWHRIDEKIGADASPGTVFKGRVAGDVATDLSLPEGDLITSRILWLQGMQPGYNQGGQVDSRSRYIYIHGTAQEHLIGSAVSMGCIRMRNDEVIALFDLVEPGTAVFIYQHRLG